MVRVGVPLDGGRVEIEIGFVRLPQGHPLEQIAHIHLKGIAIPIREVAPCTNVKEWCRVLGHAALGFLAVYRYIVNAGRPRRETAI